MQKVWDFIIDNDIASEETLTIIAGINGESEETLNEVIFAVTGYKNIEEYMEMA